MEKNKKQINAAQLSKIVKQTIEDQKDEISVIIERVSAMPGQGVTSMFNFGQSFGVIKVYSLLLRYPYILLAQLNGRNILI